MPPTFRGEFDPFAGPRPRVVLLERSPWGSVPGAENPRLSLYEDGRIVFAKSTGFPASRYHTHRLSEESFGEVEERLAAASGLRPVYDLTGRTDQPEVSLYADLGREVVVTRLYGLGLPRPGRSHVVFSGHGPVRTSLPQPVPLLEHLATLDFEASVEWEPQFVEVMLRPADPSSGRAVAWPADWPDLDSDRAGKRGGDSWSIFLAGAQLPRLLELRERDQAPFVALGSRTWAYSFRETFPGEPRWREALGEIRSIPAGGPPEGPPEEGSTELATKIREPARDRRIPESRRPWERFLTPEDVERVMNACVDPRPAGVPVRLLLLGGDREDRLEVARGLADMLYGSPQRVHHLDLSSYGERDHRLLSGQLPLLMQTTPRAVLYLDRLDEAHEEVRRELCSIVDGREIHVNTARLDFGETAVVVGVDEPGAPAREDLGAEPGLADQAGRLRIPVGLLARFHVVSALRAR